MHTMGKFLLELCLPDYSMLEFHPSLLAAAALYLAMQVYHIGDWVCVLFITREHTPCELYESHKYCRCRFLSAPRI